MYLGKLLDPHSHQPTDTPLDYDSNDLTTHAVCVGMTGSGKTGLCIDLLEEAALAGLPAILIDPKGDLTNLLLTFPELRPADFRPWVNPDDARRAGLSLDEFAAKVANDWREGLAGWGYGPAQMRRLKDSAEFVIYTPGSEAGRAVSILASLAAPDLAWDENQEALRDRIGSLCSALLGLVGVEADPVKSREHILLAHLFENAWRNGEAMDLAGLIAQVQQPPFDKLGVFDVDTFFPPSARFGLARALNNIVAAPAFQSWISGEPLDVARLFQVARKPQFSIFYIAHLNEAERMFFVTLLLEQIGAWLRAQTGVTSLRALLYFDEVFGYFPPHPYNPPSKTPLLRLLKQARAFGLGIVLVTQNPGDLDYKGLTNTGTWFIGKLQTERDKARLLEGLETISTASRSTLDTSTLDTLISSLAPRTFLLHNVHAPTPVVFHTRWAMSYLAGPLSKEQVRTLMADSRWQIADGKRQVTEGVSLPARSTFHPPPAARPSLPAEVHEHFFPVVVTLHEAVSRWKTDPARAEVDLQTAQLVYRPTLLAQAVIRYVNTKAGINEDKSFAFLAEDVERGRPIDWAAVAIKPLDIKSLSDEPQPGSSFGEMPPGLSDLKKLAAWQKSLTDYLYRAAGLAVLHNPTLKLYSRPGASPREFRQSCEAAARAQRDAEIGKPRARYDKKLDTLEAKLAKESDELEADREEHEARRAEQRWVDIENVVGFAIGRSPYRALSTSTRARRLADKAKQDIAESEQTIKELQAQIAALKAEAQAAFAAVGDKWAQALDDIQETRLTPKKADILVETFGVAWRPYWSVKVAGERVEIEAWVGD